MRNSIIGLCLLSVSWCSYADNYENEYKEDRDEINYLLAIRSGFDWAKTGVDQTLEDTAGNDLNYEVGSQWRTEPNIGGFFGVEGFAGILWKWHLGVGIYQTAPFTAEGHIEQNKVEAAIWDYEYSIHNRRLLLENRWSLEYDNGFAAFAEVGAGVAHNKASEFSETSLVTGTPVISHFDNNSQTSFTYFIGAGITWDMLEQLRLGVGYRFADLGRVELGEQTLPAGGDSDNSLTNGHMYSNELLVELIYLFDMN